MSNCLSQQGSSLREWARSGSVVYTVEEAVPIIEAVRSR